MALKMDIPPTATTVADTDAEIAAQKAHHDTLINENQEIIDDLVASGAPEEHINDLKAKMGMAESTDDNKQTTLDNTLTNIDKAEPTDLEKKVDETRTKYAEEYLKCKKEVRKQVAIDRVKNALTNVFKSKANKKTIKEEDYFSEEFKKTKQEYNEARVAMGNAMFAEKKAEYEKAGFTGEALTEKLTTYKAREILKKTIIDERNKLIEAKAAGSPINPAMWKRAVNAYLSIQPRWKRIALSTAIFLPAAAGGAAAATYGIAGLATIKFAKSMLIGTVAAHATAGIDKIKAKSDAEFEKNQRLQRLEMDDKFGKGEITQEEYEKSDTILRNEEKKRDRNRAILKMSVGIAIGAGAAYEAQHLMMSGVPHTVPEVSHATGPVPFHDPDHENHMIPKTQVPAEAATPKVADMKVTNPLKVETHTEPVVKAPIAEAPKVAEHQAVLKDFHQGGAIRPMEGQYQTGGEADINPTNNNYYTGDGYHQPVVVDEQSTGHGVHHPAATGSGNQTEVLKATDTQPEGQPTGAQQAPEAAPTQNNGAVAEQPKAAPVGNNTTTNSAPIENTGKELVMKDIKENIQHRQNINEVNEVFGKDKIYVEEKTGLGLKSITENPNASKLTTDDIIAEGKRASGHGFESYGEYEKEHNMQKLFGYGEEKSIPDGEDTNTTIIDEKYFRNNPEWNIASKIPAKTLLGSFTPGTPSVDGTPMTLEDLEKLHKVGILKETIITNGNGEQQHLFELAQKDILSRMNQTYGPLNTIPADNESIEHYVGRVSTNLRHTEDGTFYATKEGVALQHEYEASLKAGTPTGSQGPSVIDNAPKATGTPDILKTGTGSTVVEKIVTVQPSGASTAEHVMGTGSRAISSQDLPGGNTYSGPVNPAAGMYPTSSGEQPAVNNFTRPTSMTTAQARAQLLGQQTNAAREVIKTTVLENKGIDINNDYHHMHSVSDIRKTLGHKNGEWEKPDTKEIHGTTYTKWNGASDQLFTKGGLPFKSFEDYQKEHELQQLFGQAAKTTQLDPNSGKMVDGLLMTHFRALPVWQIERAIPAHEYLEGFKGVSADKLEKLAQAGILKAETVTGADGAQTVSYTFPGKDDLERMAKVYKELGLPNEKPTPNETIEEYVGRMTKHVYQADDGTFFGSKVIWNRPLAGAVQAPVDYGRGTAADYEGNRLTTTPSRPVRDFSRGSISPTYGSAGYGNITRSWWN